MARGVVAHLRTAIVVHPGALDIHEVVDELTDRSAEFAALWQRHEVRARTNGRKVYRHPTAGRMTLTYEAFEVARSDGRRLVVYQAPPDTADHEALLSLSAGPGGRDAGLDPVDG